MIAKDTAAKLTAVLMSGLVASAWAKPPFDCIRIDIPVVLSAPDPACRVSSNPLAKRYLPDLELPTSVDSCGVLPPANAQLADADGHVVDVTYSAEFGVAMRNTVSGGSITPLPVPLFDIDGVPRVYIPFTAADVVEIRAKGSGNVLGRLVVRNAGYLEIDPGLGVPVFVSERQVITHGTGPLFAGSDAVGEIVGDIMINGDAFVAGATGAGSVCGHKLGKRLQQLARSRLGAS